MFLIIKDKKFNTENINISLHPIYNFYHIYYDTNYIKLSGIPLTIKYNKIIEKNDRFFIYYDDDDNNIDKINYWFNLNIPDFYFIRQDINNCEKYIIGNSYKDISDSSSYKINGDYNTIDLIIYKIKYIKGKYIPIINII